LDKTRKPRTLSANRRSLGPETLLLEEARCHGMGGGLLKEGMVGKHKECDKSIPPEI